MVLLGRQLIEDAFETIQLISDLRKMTDSTRTLAEAQQEACEAAITIGIADTDVASVMFIFQYPA